MGEDWQPAESRGTVSGADSWGFKQTRAWQGAHLANEFDGSGMVEVKQPKARARNGSGVCV